VIVMNLTITPTPTATCNTFGAPSPMSFVLTVLHALLSPFIVLIERRAQAVALAPINARCAGTRTRRPAR
jgi:hypothetical protein